MQASNQILALSSGMWVVFIIVGIGAMVFLLVVFQFFGLWLQAYMSRASVGFTDLIGMRLRKVHLPTLVHSKIQLVKAGIADDDEHHPHARREGQNLIARLHRFNLSES